MALVLTDHEFDDLMKRTIDQYTKEVCNQPDAAMPKSVLCHLITDTEITDVEEWLANSAKQDGIPIPSAQT